MSDWTSNEAREFLSIVRGEAEKVVKDCGNRQSSIYACLAVVTNIATSGDISVRLLSSPADGSQDFVVRNRSGSTLEVGDSVWLHYWSDYTNVYIAMRNAGDGESDLTPDDIGAQPNNAVSSNLLINGGFDVWQRGASFSSGYAADRWKIDFNGTGATRAITRQAFTVGQTAVPSNPAYFLRFAQSIAGSGGAYNLLYQRVEDVSRLSGKTVTLSFYAKADSARNIKTQIDQNFGSGGSATVYVGEAVTHALTTSWQLFTRTVTLPSISGKTVAASNCSEIYFVMPLNTTFTIDIANVQLNYGCVALPFVPRSYADELRLCQRYYLPITASSIFAGIHYAGNTTAQVFIPTPVPMRASPTVLGTVGGLLYTPSSALVPTSVAVAGIKASGVLISLGEASLSGLGNFCCSWETGSGNALDAEL